MITARVGADWQVALFQLALYESFGKTRLMTTPKSVQSLNWRL